MKKIPLIFVPGLLCDQALWRYQVASLSPVAECTVTDAHLGSDSIERMAEAIVAAAPARFALAGLSMGGYIALEICRRFGERVARLALIDTSARADTLAQTQRRELFMAQCREEGVLQIAEALYPLMVDPSRLDDGALKRQVIEMAVRVGPEVFLRQQRAIIDRIDQVPNLPNIGCPTVIICGEHDLITPLECAEEMAENISHSELAVVRHCGHMSTMEKPGHVSSILDDWLTRK